MISETVCRLMAGIAQPGNRPLNCQVLLSFWLIYCLMVEVGDRMFCMAAIRHNMAGLPSRRPLP